MDGTAPLLKSLTPAPNPSNQRDRWRMGIARTHLLRGSGMPLSLPLHQELKTLTSRMIGLLAALPRNNQNSLLPLLNRARKSSASMKMPISTASATISSGVAEA